MLVKILKNGVGPGYVIVEASDVLPPTPPPPPPARTVSTTTTESSTTPA